MIKSDYYYITGDDISIISKIPGLRANTLIKYGTYGKFGNYNRMITLKSKSYFVINIRNIKTK